MVKKPPVRGMVRSRLARFLFLGSRPFSAREALIYASAHSST
jgi:hypothetical protein